MPSAILLRTASRRQLPRVQVAKQARALHVDNTLNNNFPFKYEKKRTFVAKSTAFLGFSFAIPFAACKFKTTKQ